jgi:CheY-like chemotaxis protein
VGLCIQQVGFDVFDSGDVESAERAIVEFDPHLIVLDVSMPGRSGLDLLRTLDRRHLAVILLSGRASEQDRILGLSLGADDYVVKPFSVGELVARVHAVLRRTHATDAHSRMDFGWLVVDRDRHEVYVKSQLVDLTAKEFDLLVHLASSPARCSRASSCCRPCGPPRRSGRTPRPSPSTCAGSATSSSRPACPAGSRPFAARGTSSSAAVPRGSSGGVRRAARHPVRTGSAGDVVAEHRATVERTS